MTRFSSSVLIATPTTLAGAGIFLLIVAFIRGNENPLDTDCYGPTIKEGSQCPGEETDPRSAINTPTIYAWTTFARINQPAFPGNKDDTRRVWETWKSADDNGNPDEAIYLDNGHPPRKWNVKPRAAQEPKRLVPIQQLQLLRAQNKEANFLPQFIPTNPLAEEVRVNRPAFNFIQENQLYNRQGQYQHASTHSGFDFPRSSKEVKAVWVEAQAGTRIADYYSARAGEKTYILIAMHIITKDIPFWHWSSFIHKDRNKDPGNGYVAPLANYQETPASLKGTPFENYRVIAELVQSSGTLSPSGNGAQVDWITRTGLSTVMGNPYIEQGFETKSSCITCHAHASIGLARDGVVKYNTFPLEVGAVNSQEFSKEGVVYYPLDFLWSLRQAKNYKP